MIVRQELIDAIKLDCENIREQIDLIRITLKGGQKQSVDCGIEWHQNEQEQSDDCVSEALLLPPSFVNDV